MPTLIESTLFESTLFQSLLYLFQKKVMKKIPGAGEVRTWIAQCQVVKHATNYAIWDADDN